MREIEVIACNLTIKHGKETYKIMTVDYLGDTVNKTHTLPEAMELVKPQITSGYAKDAEIEINDCKIEHLRIPDKEIISKMEEPEHIKKWQEWMGKKMRGRMR